MGPPRPGCPACRAPPGRPRGGRAWGGLCRTHHRPALLLSPAVLRDISERGRDLEQILSQYITFVKPAFEEFCLPVSCALGLLPSLEIKSIRRTRLRVAAVLCAEGPGRGMSRPLPSSSVLPLVFPLARRFPSWNPSRLCTPCWAGSGCGGPFIGGQTRPSGSEPRCRVPLQRPPALRRPPSVRLPPRAFPSVCGEGCGGRCARRSFLPPWQLGTLGRWPLQKEGWGWGSSQLLAKQSSLGPGNTLGFLGKNKK